jgi:hypothetical protein
MESIESSQFPSRNEQQIETKNIKMEQPTLRDAEEENSKPSDPQPKKKKTLTWKRILFLLIFLMLFLIVPLTLSVVLGGPLAWAEKTEKPSFLDGFLYVASNLLNLATPLTDFNPNNVVGVVIDVETTGSSLLSLRQ